MRQREDIISELWRRLYTVTGISRVVRNPTTPVDIASLPSINILEREDEVVERTMRNGLPSYRRNLEVGLELFINGSSEGAATNELMEFANDVKRIIFADGVSLGGLCEIAESSCSPVAIGAGGEHIRAIGITFDIRYVEEVSALFE